MTAPSEALRVMVMKTVLSESVLSESLKGLSPLAVSNHFPLVLPETWSTPFSLVPEKFPPPLLLSTSVLATYVSA